MNQTIEIPHKFRCRNYQIPAWEALKAGKKRVVCAWHRGAGKDLFALNYLITEALQKPGVYLHCFPKYSQGKKAIWSSVHNTEKGESMAYLDHFPPEIIKYKNSTDMRLELINGSIYCVLGLDGKNAQQIRGMNPSFIILSEYAYMDPQGWWTIEPRISQNNGTAIFLSTPNGQNHFYNLYNHASKEDQEDYFASLLTIEETHVLPSDHIEKLRGENYPEDFLQQEYYCSFTRGAEGAYYGKYIQKARDEDRICKLSINRDLPCHTAWDIGIGDANSIWIFQLLNNGNINLLHYYENHNEGLPHYISMLEDWKAKNKIVWGKHYVPHDMQNKEYTSGVDRLEAARQLGYEMQVVPKKSVEDGIHAVRNILDRCSFDSIHCKRGVECLDFYHKKWNDILKVYYDVPVHDQWSHGADAFRYLAVGINAFSVNGKLTSDKIIEMRVRNYGY